MLVSMWFYALAFGWFFGVGFVLLIFVHEMGHVFVAWRQGLPISAPVFIPFMGAVIFQREASKTAWSSAIMGIGGPVAGTLGALACWGIYALTGYPLFLGLAYVGFFLNLFNLLPIVPLDGGWIAGAISPWLWLIGAVGLVCLYVFDIIHNPFIILIVLLAIPHLWHGLRNKGAPIGGTPATLEQRVVMACCYVGLCLFLGWAMAHTHSIDPLRKSREASAQPTLDRGGDGGFVLPSEDGLVE
jgi:Zn-dependent protease